MTEQPLVSCIVPVYNQAIYLGEAIDSILAQTYRPLEVIVIDDGSTDDAAAAVARTSDQVRYLWQPNRGPAAARNRGVAVSNGAYLAFLDGDDLWLPDKLTKQMAFLQAHPDVDVCVGFSLGFWIPELAAEAEALKDSHLARPQRSHTFSCALMARAVFDRVGPLDTSLSVAEDVEWMTRAEDLGLKFHALDDILVRRRYHHTNISRFTAEPTMEKYFTLVRRRLSHKHRPTSGS